MLMGGLLIPTPSTNHKKDMAMRNIASKKDPKLQKEQLDNLLAIIKILKDPELKHFIISVLSESEHAYIAQRLDIMQMLIGGYSYAEIIRILNVSNTTVQRAQVAVEKIESSVMNKLKKHAIIHKDPKDNNIFYYPDKANNRLVNPHYPGSPW